MIGLTEYAWVILSYFGSDSVGSISNAEGMGQLIEGA